MKIDILKKFIIDETHVLTDSDKSHIDNYKKIIVFLEQSLSESFADNENSNKKLVNAYLQCIRFLENIVAQYNSNLSSAKSINLVLNKIIDEINQTDSKKKEEENLKNKELSELDQ